MLKNNKKNEFEMIMEALNGINAKVEKMENRLDALEKEKVSAKATVKKTAVKETKAKEPAKKAAKETKKASAKATTKKATGKKETAKETKKPQTYKEAIASRYSDEERKAYGQACKEVREEMMAENKKKVKVVKGEKVYADDYFVGAKWTKEFDKRMKARGFGK